METVQKRVLCMHVIQTCSLMALAINGLKSASAEQFGLGRLANDNSIDRFKIVCRGFGGRGNFIPDENDCCDERQNNRQSYVFFHPTFARSGFTATLECKAGNFLRRHTRFLSRWLAGVFRRPLGSWRRLRLSCELLQSL